jgi:hypothetical protein
MRYMDQLEQLPWVLKIAFAVVGLVIMTFAGMAGLLILKLAIVGLC